MVMFLIYVLFFCCKLFVCFSFGVAPREEIFTFEKTNSDLSPQTFNHSHYRNKSLKRSTHYTAFEGISFFKSKKFLSPREGRRWILEWFLRLWNRIFCKVAESFCA